MRCVAASACSPPSFAAGDPRYDVDEFPVTSVTWEDASSYCRWVGGRLPTEAEWELAARGYSNNTFPWGKIYSPRLANHGAFADDPTDGRDGFIGLAPVGSFPDGATPTGLLDMAGNASEWVADWYDRDEQQFGYKRGAQTNPKGPPYGQLGHVIRGGSYRDGAHWLRAAARYASTFAAREVGFRCAADAR
jgi:formylglycine-generating enzyme required for sulfatase activity